MADINVKVPHGKDIATVQPVVATILDKMAGAMGFEVSWSDATATLSGAAIKKGVVAVDATNVTVEISLALFAKPMRGMIEGKIKEKFEKHLGA